MSRPELSIIVPTLNEAENLPLLVPRIHAAVGGGSYEIIVVDDDSRDHTAEVCAELARVYPLRLIVRREGVGGLSGAVLEGFAAAEGEILLVMDADLQHPPERIGALLEPLRRGESDFVLGSRHVSGGSTAERWGMARRWNSAVATWLARPFAGRMSDPMSGFFALRRETLAGAQRLTPLGYKIGLELMCKCRVRRPVEVPIAFGLREKGQSKLSLREQFRYLEHLSRLYDFTFPRASPIVKFLIVLAASWFVGLAAFLWLIHAGVDRDIAPPLAYLGALAVTALFHMRYVRTQRAFLVRPRPWGDFAFISVCELGACALAAAWIGHRVPVRWAPEIFLVPFGCATVVRYVLRKELMQDIRGLRREPRREEMD
jgi:dolichol-phosphate mannosyltransferase